MTAAAVLAALTAAAGWWAPARLERAAWTLRAPRAAAALWCALLGFCATALAMGLHQALTGGHGSGWLLGPLTGAPGPYRAEGLAGHTEAFALAALVMAAAGGVAAAGCARAARARARHRRLLDLVARPDADGTLLVEDPRPAAWCVPGRGGRIVLTRGAAVALTDRQRAAVVAHERAHLAGHHHLLVAGVRALGRPLAWVPLARAAARRVPVLCEMAADDAAVRSVGRDAVARALCRVAAHPAPEGTLAAGAEAALERVRRLTHPRTALSAPARTACWIAVATLPVLPLLIGCGP
ncbi:M56 family metallopeptidase [Kitasatospora sp. NPDC085879]|uniref:M56 family metallopeptidase n=1 Tax=Kitasatospora sp. NPDC085879 TaxID=3154769 RepID=UPI00342EA7D6